MPLLGPSVMCADWGNLRRDIESLDRGGADYFHLDIMDGQFVPNFTMGPDALKALRDCTDKPFDVHLMTDNPDRFVDMFADAGADWISLHAESVVHLQRALRHIKDRGLRAGVALNPATPLSVLEYVLDVTDYVLLMTVNPGFAGQAFIPSMLDKLDALRKMLDDHGKQIDIQVDGNISYETIPRVLERGASLLVCGTSSLFRSGDLEQSAVRLKQYVAGIRQAG